MLALALMVAAYFLVRDGGETSPDLTSDKPKNGQPLVHAHDFSSDDGTDSPPDLQSSTEKISEPVAKLDPFLHSSSINEIHELLLADGEISDRELALSIYSWVDACSFSVNSLNSANQRPAFGLTSQAAETLHYLCSDFVEEMSGDVHTYREAWIEAADGLKNPFFEQANRGDMDGALKAAVEAIFRSRSEVEILSAVNTIVFHAELDSPFPGVSPESVAPLFQGPLTYHVSLAFLCENLGGCSGSHPLVARHCLSLERHDGCYQPRDMYHAIEQTLNPIQYELFLSLMTQIRQMRRRLESGRP